MAAIENVWIIRSIYKQQLAITVGCVTGLPARRRVEVDGLRCCTWVIKSSHVAIVISSFIKVRENQKATEAIVEPIRLEIN